MNKIQICVDSILAVAVVALFVLFFTQKPAEKVLAAAPTEGAMPVAYLNLDSLLVNYTFAVEAADRLMAKQEDARLKLNTKVRTLQNEMGDFQRKLENNAFLSRERAEQEQQRLLRKQAELEQLEQQLTQEIMLENQNLNLQLADTLDNFLKQFNADGRYHMILSNQGRDNVLMADKSYDITEEVIAALNARCKK